MKSKYLNLLGLHIVIGVLMYFYKSLGDIYFFSIVAYFVFKIINTKRKEKPLIILKACAYVVGVEVLLRMTGGVIFYEASKYLVILFSLIGFYYNGFNKKAIPYLFYILFLIPSIYVSLYSPDIGDNIRKAIAFNLSGPFCLGISALFCYNLKLTKKELDSAVNYILFPLVSTLIYIIFYNPDVSRVAIGTGSNFIASGGFGPNQVSTVLGIGMFVLTVRFFIISQTKTLKIIDLSLLALFSFRAIVTFSRGGVFTAIAMIFFFLFILFKTIDKKQKTRIIISIFIFLGLGLAIWIISSIQTSGYIDKRYANQNAMGIEKDDVTTGRSDLFLLEFQEFIDNPFFGVGVGRVKDLRFQKTGIHAASHNEMSRIIAEHGMFGITAFSILLLVPLFYRFGNRNNVYFYSFYLFWLLTINHSAMRIAAPGFIYALTLLNVRNEKVIVHRE